MAAGRPIPEATERPSALGPIEGHHDFTVLEARLADLIDGCKREAPEGPFAPIAVVAPTRRLLAHLQLRLAEQRPGLVAVHFYHHEALARAAAAAAGVSLPRLLSEDVREAILADIVAREGGPLAAHTAARPGSLAILLDVFDDLREAGVDLTADLAAPRPAKRGRQVLAVYRAYASRLDALRPQGPTDRAGRAQLAADCAEAFARRFRLIVHYGAYELIGVNLAFLHRAARSGTPVRFLAPYHPTSPAFAHARRFWSEQLGVAPVFLPEVAGPALLGPSLPDLYREESRPSPAAAGAIRFFHAQGTAAELREVALRILALQREARAPLRRVAVVGRSLEPYAADLRPVFAGHSLPFTTTAALGAPREAAVQAALNLVRVIGGDFERQPLIDLFRSGLCTIAGRDVADQAHVWDDLSRRWQVSRGYEAWTKDLPRWIAAAEPFLPEDADEAFRDRVLAAQQARIRAADALAAAVTALRQAASQAAAAASWAAWADGVDSLLSTIMGAGNAGGDAASGEPARGVIFDLMLEVLAEVRDLDGARLPFSSRSAMLFFERALARRSVPIGSVGADGSGQAGDNGGVRILDAMQARGLTFDHVFLIGFNADLIPRRAREVPFLGDLERRRLKERLGAPIPIGSDAAGEEHLLLAHLLGCACRSLTISWQRADDAGRARVPSLMLREAARLAFGQPDAALVERAADRVPTHPAQWLARAVQTHGILPPGAAAAGVALALRSPLRLLATADRLPAAAVDDPARLRAGLAMMASIDEAAGPDRRYDAFVGGAVPPPAHWSPSRLEAIGACPQRFFFRHLLHVDELDEAMEGYDIDRLEVGLGLHAALRDVFAALMEAPTPLRPGNETLTIDLALRTMRQSVELRAGRIAARMRRYPLLREALLATWRDSLERLVRAEVAALCARRTTILGVEHAATASLDLAGGGGQGDPVIVEGRFDRADARGEDAIVITDYKTGGADLESHVDAATMLKGARLQMPVYVLMAEELRAAWQRPRARVTAEVLGAGPAFDRAAEFPVRASIDPEKFEANRAGLLETLTVLVDLARAGLFPFNREDSRYCGHCPYVRACRRLHPPTVARLEADPRLEAYRRLRGKSTRAPLLADVARRAAPEATGRRR